MFGLGGWATALHEITGRKAKLHLRAALITLFLGIVVPLLGVLGMTLLRLQEEAFLKERFNSEQSALVIEEELSRILEQEENRPVDHYGYYRVSKSNLTNQSDIEYSPLAAWPPPKNLPGLVGYFELSGKGALTSPLLPPEEVALPVKELAERKAAVEKVQNVLNLVQNYQRTGMKPAPRYAENDVKAPAQQAITQESLISAEALANRSKTGFESLYDNSQIANLKSRGHDAYERRGFDMESQGQIKQKYARVENVFSNVAPPLSFFDKTSKSAGEAKRQAEDAGIEPLKAAAQKKESADAHKSPLSLLQEGTISFEAVVDPLQAISVGDSYLLIFRKVWKNSERTIQGLILESRTFFQAVLPQALIKSSLPPSTTVLLASASGPVARFETPSAGKAGYHMKSASQVLVAQPKLPPSGREILLYSRPLLSPLQNLQLYFSSHRLLYPPGTSFVAVLSALLLAFLTLGLFVLYRLGMSHITLAQKRSDFVSAVSHELKTPLTAIRMYGEMLKNDWVKDEEKRQSYYAHIFEESERLSRLISNILQLSRLTHNSERLDLEPIGAANLLDELKEKVQTLFNKAGYELVAQIDTRLAADAPLLVSRDAMNQICINLVDNAIKFSKNSEKKEVHIGFKPEDGAKKILFYVRDFGPGVAKAEQRKIFQLFYRSGTELTRNTSGTGIGLALVRELAFRMNAKVDYRSREPGAEFQIIFPRVH